jgi:hypothetical protein
MDISQFNDISIRGRTAFGICCLERILAKDNVRSKGWEFLLNFMWELVSLPDTDHENDGRCIDDLSRSYSECHSRAIACRLRGDKIRWTYTLSEEQFLLLAEIYKNFENYYPIIDKIFDVGLGEFCGGVNYPGYLTSMSLNELIVLVKKTRIELPAIEPFKKYVFGVNTRDDDYCYGTAFDGKNELSIYFKP